MYSSILPKYGIKKVHFRCDGAGCFIGKIVKGSFGLWTKLRTGGVEEVTYKKNVPGKGKSSLDGHFGVLTQEINLQVDEGASFGSAKELYELCLQHPLKCTEYHLFDPQRNKVQYKIPQDIVDLKLGRTYYFLSFIDGKVKGFCHSRHGNGKSLPSLQRAVEGMCIS